MFKKWWKWAITSGALIMPLSIAISCASTLKDEEKDLFTYQFDGKVFKSQANLNEYLKANYLNSKYTYGKNNTFHWTLDGVEQKFATLDDLNDYVEANFTEQITANIYLENSLDEVFKKETDPFLAQIPPNSVVPFILDDEGEIVNPNQGLAKVYKGFDGAVYFTTDFFDTEELQNRINYAEENAKASWVQIRQAYKYNNIYFHNKNDLTYYLNYVYKAAYANDPNSLAFLQKYQVVFDMLVNGKVSKASYTIQTDVWEDDQGQTQVKATNPQQIEELVRNSVVKNSDIMLSVDDNLILDEDGVFIPGPSSKKRYISLDDLKNNTNDAASLGNNLKYWNVGTQDGNSFYIVDSYKGSPGDLFGPYFVNSPTSVGSVSKNGQKEGIMNPDGWKEVDLGKNEKELLNYYDPDAKMLGSILSMALNSFDLTDQQQQIDEKGSFDNDDSLAEQLDNYNTSVEEANNLEISFSNLFEYASNYFKYNVKKPGEEWKKDFFDGYNINLNDQDLFDYLDSLKYPNPLYTSIGSELERISNDLIQGKKYNPFYLLPILRNYAISRLMINQASQQVLENVNNVFIALADMVSLEITNLLRFVSLDASWNEKDSNGGDLLKKYDLTNNFDLTSIYGFDNFSASLYNDPRTAVYEAFNGTKQGLYDKLRVYLFSALNSEVESQIQQIIEQVNNKKQQISFIGIYNSVKSSSDRTSWSNNRPTSYQTYLQAEEEQFKVFSNPNLFLKTKDKVITDLSVGDFNASFYDALEKQFNSYAKYLDQTFDDDFADGKINEKPKLNEAIGEYNDLDPNVWYYDRYGVVPYRPLEQKGSRYYQYQGITLKDPDTNVELMTGVKNMSSLSLDILDLTMNTVLKYNPELEKTWGVKAYHFMTYAIGKAKNIKNLVTAQRDMMKNFDKLNKLTSGTSEAAKEISKLNKELRKNKKTLQTFTKTFQTFAKVVGWIGIALEVVSIIIDIIAFFFPPTKYEDVDFGYGLPNGEKVIWNGGQLATKGKEQWYEHGPDEIELLNPIQLTVPHTNKNSGDHAGNASDFYFNGSFYDSPVWALNNAIDTIINLWTRLDFTKAESLTDMNSLVNSLFRNVKVVYSYPFKIPNGKDQEQYWLPSSPKEDDSGEQSPDQNNQAFQTLEDIVNNIVYGGDPENPTASPSGAESPILLKAKNAEEATWILNLKGDSKYLKSIWKTTEGYVEDEGKGIDNYIKEILSGIKPIYIFQSPLPDGKTKDGQIILRQEPFSLPWPYFSMNSNKVEKEGQVNPIDPYQEPYDPNIEDDYSEYDLGTLNSGEMMRFMRDRVFPKFSVENNIYSARAVREAGGQYDAIEEYAMFNQQVVRARSPLGQVMYFWNKDAALGYLKQPDLLNAQKVSSDEKIKIYTYTGPGSENIDWDMEYYFDLELLYNDLFVKDLLKKFDQNGNLIPEGWIEMEKIDPSKVVEVEDA